MLVFNKEQSFIAFVQCHTPGFEGYLDCGEVALKEGKPMRRAADWLTVTSFAQREPHRFWFRCFEDQASSARFFDIQSWSRRTGRDMHPAYRHAWLSANGYVKMDDEENDLQRLWRVTTFDGENSTDIGRDLKIGTVDSIEILTPDSIALCARGREQAGDYWHCYAATAGGPLLQLSLDIVDLGEELLDDH
ncbi:hypothetical protein ACIQUS_05560 [Pseudomonas sp. NPDC090755]|uniref:hypothetical protein n=1 Tax=Pseudomonas sp. NPDC090755 TaxID=3364481 RepID=UPI00383B4C0E